MYLESALTVKKGNESQHEDGRQSQHQIVWCVTHLHHACLRDHVAVYLDPREPVEREQNEVLASHDSAVDIGDIAVCVPLIGSKLVLFKTSIGTQNRRRRSGEALFLDNNHERASSIDNGGAHRRNFDEVLAEDQEEDQDNCEYTDKHQFCLLR
jgi:hypothetical protein